MSLRRALLTAFVLIIPGPGQAQWQLDGTPVTSAAGLQHLSKSVSDGAGGMIVAWVDLRGGDADIYAQRINSSGVVQWTLNGIAVCTAAGPQTGPAIASDGAGGAILVWSDQRSDGGDIYAQRVNAAGLPQWTANGVALCTALDVQDGPVIVADGAGGAVVAWRDNRVLTFAGDVYAQRVNALGVVQWAADGVGLCVTPAYQASAAIASDGAAGAIVAWNDYRNGNYDIYAQRINATGTPQWTANGIGICTELAQQYGATVVAVGGGSTFIVWNDYRSGNSDILMQKVDGSGGIQLITDGAYVSSTAGDQWIGAVVPDGAGGVFVAWTDDRDPSGPDIYAHRVNGAGNPVWLLNGVPVCDLPSAQYVSALVTDGMNGVLVAWQDFRSGVIQVYTQRLNSSGIPLWQLNGVALSVTPAQSRDWISMVSDGLNGAVVAWDVNYGGFTDVYAQRAEADFGAWGSPEPTLETVADVPDDQGGKVAVNWTRSGHDILSLHEITHYSVWRAVDAVESSAMQNDGDTWLESWSVDPSFDGRALAHERIGATDYYWEWVANQDATNDRAYSYSATTREDSVANSTSTHHFRVVAHTGDQYVYFKSNVASGHSVDNLAPLAPFLLTAQRVGNDVQLKWNRAIAPDLRDYAIYRATSSGVTPVPINFLESAEDTLAIDANAPSSALYYIVTAYDVHANQSAPSNEASVVATTGVGDTPGLTVLAVLQNHPNPFNATTDFEIGLPSGGDVRIEVFDVAGRRVSTIDVKGAKAGWQRVPFAGRDDRGRSLASGVYFYRVKAAGGVITKKMVIAR